MPIICPSARPGVQNWKHSRNAKGPQASHQPHQREVWRLEHYGKAHIGHIVRYHQNNHMIEQLVYLGSGPVTGLGSTPSSPCEAALLVAILLISGAKNLDRQPFLGQRQGIRDTTQQLTIVRCRHFLSLAQLRVHHVKCSQCPTLQRFQHA